MQKILHAASPGSREAVRVPLWQRHTTIAAAVTGVLVLIAAACGSAPATTEPASPGGLGGGGDLYQSNCASCHGANLQGTDKGPSHLSIVYEPNHHGDDAFRSAIINGAQQHHWNFGEMAAITGLDDDQIDDVIAYVRSEQERQGFEQ
ncbi:MAG: mono/diheme cytochrome c family protein [Ilumatobacter sp.]